MLQTLVAGIRGFRRKVRRCKESGAKLYRTAAESGKARQLKKVLGAREWYWSKRRLEDEDVGWSQQAWEW